MAMLWHSPHVKLESQGDLLDVMRVFAICDTCLLILLRNNVGESAFSFSMSPYGNRPDLINAWKPLQIPRIRPSFASSVCTAAATFGLLNTCLLYTSQCSCIGRSSHFAAQRIYFPHNDSFCRTSDARIAGHRCDHINMQRIQHCFFFHSGTG